MGGPGTEHFASLPTLMERSRDSAPDTFCCGPRCRIASRSPVEAATSSTPSNVPEPSLYSSL